MVDWVELMNDMADQMVKNLRKVKKGETPLPSYLVHLYAHYELVAPREQEFIEDVLCVPKYGGLETDSRRSQIL